MVRRATVAQKYGGGAARARRQVSSPLAHRALGNWEVCDASAPCAPSSSPVELGCRGGAQVLRHAGGAGKIPALAKRSAASAQQCRQRGVFACAPFPGLETRQTLARRALSARGVQRTFSLCKPLTTFGECNAALLGHRARSCTLCWRSDGARVNAALTACAWCSLEAGGKFLAAPKLLYAAGEWFLPALAAKLLVKASSRPPFVARLYRANQPFCTCQAPLRPPFFTFQAPFTTTLDSESR